MMQMLSINIQNSNECSFDRVFSHSTVYFKHTLNEKMFGAKSFGENNFGEQMFGGFFYQITENFGK